MREAIAADVLVLYSDEDPLVAQGIGAVMEAGFPYLCEQLKAAGVLSKEEVLRWWHGFSEGDRTGLVQPFALAARMYLSMPAGGAPSESAFSATTGIVTKKRNRLGDETVEQLLVVRHWVQRPEYKFKEMCDRVQSTVDEAELQKILNE